MSSAYDHLGPGDPASYRRVSRAWAGTVTVVSARRRDEAVTTAVPRIDGFTATAFLTVSIDPPIVLVSAARGTGAEALLADSEVFAVHLLAADQGETAEAFARPHEEREDLWDTLRWDPDPEGRPILRGALGVFVAKVRERIDAGDHTLVLGDVTDLLEGEEGTPLVYHNRQYVTVGPRPSTVAPPGIVL